MRKIRYCSWSDNWDNGEINKIRSTDIEEFVECYLLFEGIAGKCVSCYAEKSCRRLNIDCKDYHKIQMETIKKKNNQ